MKLTILGPPRTKKNSSIINTRGGRIQKLPSAAYSAWDRMAQLQIAKLWATSPLRPPLFLVPVNVKAIFCREALVGDAVASIRP